MKGLFGPPCPCARLTHQIVPEKPCRQGSSNCRQFLATHTIPIPLHQPVCGLASLRTFTSTHDDNKSHNDRSSVPTLNGNHPQSLEVPVQPSWSGYSHVPSTTPDAKGLPNRYLYGIGAWQTGQLPGCTYTLSLAAAS